MSGKYNLVRWLGRILFLLVLVIPLTTCTESKDLTDVWEECIDYAIENAKDAYDNCVERSEDIREACLDAADNDAEEKACKKEHEARLKECVKKAENIEQAKRDQCAKFFQDLDLIRKWTEGTNEDRKQVKKEVKGILDGITSAIMKALSFAVDAGIADRTEREATASHSVHNLMPPGALLTVLTVGMGEGIPDPTAPSTVTFTVDPLRTWTEVYLTETQDILLEGLYTLSFSPDPSGIGPYELQVVDVELLASPLDLGAVDTGLQQFRLSPYLESGGIYDESSGLIDLFVPLLASNDFLPTDTVGLGLSLMGELKTYGPTTVMTLTMSGPLSTTFTLDEPAPPLTVEASIGPEGGTLSLDGVTGLYIPQDALSRTMTVTLGFYPQELVPDVCALPAEPDDPVPGLRCIALAYEVEPDGLTLARPATLTLGYNSGLFADMYLEGAMPYAHDPPGEAWMPIPGFVHDLDQAVVRFPLQHASLYGVGAVQQFQAYLPVILKGYQYP
jgi:hypothetical protein